MATPSGKKSERARGAADRSREHVKALLGCVRKVLPMYKTQWIHVLRLYRQTHATPNGHALRQADALRGEFNQLLSRGILVDDALRPEEVAEAWEIQRSIEERAGMKTINDQVTTRCSQPQAEIRPSSPVGRPQYGGDGSRGDEEDARELEESQVDDDEAEVSVDGIHHDVVAHRASAIVSTAGLPTTQSLESKRKVTRKSSQGDAKRQRKNIESVVTLFQRYRMATHREAYQAERFLALQLKCAKEKLEEERHERMRLLHKIDELERTNEKLWQQKEMLIEQKWELKELVRKLETESRLFRQHNPVPHRIPQFPYQAYQQHRPMYQREFNTRWPY